MSIQPTFNRSSFKAWESSSSSSNHRLPQKVINTSKSMNEIDVSTFSQGSWVCFQSRVFP